MKQFEEDNAIGAFLGLALGDAYGRTLEFLTDSQVRNKIVSIDAYDFRWTDDTHMSIYLGQAILNCSSFQEDDFGREVGKQFLMWMDDPLTPSTSPGKTCLAGMKNYAALEDWRTSGITGSDGCGAVMRIVALPLVLRDEELCLAAEISAKITHAHPDALASAVAACLILQNTLEYQKLDAAYILQVAQEIQKRYPAAIHTPQALENAVRLSDRQNLEWLDEAAIPPGDGGWRSSSALGLALCAALRWGSNFEEAIDKATRINGDSDSVGCLAGMFLGAEGGTKVLPTEWIQSLPAQNDIRILAKKLYHHSTDKIDKKITSLQENIILLSQKSTDFKEDLAMFHTKMRFSIPKSDREATRILLHLAEQLGETIGNSSNCFHISIDKSLIPNQVFMDLWSQKNTSEAIDSTSIPNAEEFDTNKRTSQTHPIFVDWIDIKEYNNRYSGKIGLTLAPGKKGFSTYGKQWDRDLCVDLDRLKSFYQTDAIVCFLEDAELVYLQIPEITIRSEERGIPFYRFPIPEDSAPKSRQIKEILTVVLPLLRAGKNVIFNGRGGLGRSVTIAACALVSVGVPVQDALQKIRNIRSGTINNMQQERAILNYEKSLQNT